VRALCWNCRNNFCSEKGGAGYLIDDGREEFLIRKAL
jgi:hypothetical protein